jgi:2-phospho-L-lactate/phosphoenolpyruvate guanylyltransferase
VTSTIALIPLRSPGRGKTRLADALRPEHRAALAAAMFADVIGALCDASLDRILVAASGPEAVAAASALGVEAHIDPPWVTGLNGAIGAAAASLEATHDLLVVAADLPRLTADDVRRVLATDAEVVVAPTRDGGTGGLLRRPADRIPTAYGPASAARHRQLAADAGATHAEQHTAGFRDDVDIDADLAGLRSGPLGPATSTLLEGWTDLTDLAG